MVAFCGRILALGRWNLQMSRCKCLGVPRGQPPGMAADKCINCAGTGINWQNLNTSDGQSADGL